MNSVGVTNGLLLGHGRPAVRFGASNALLIAASMESRHFEPLETNSRSTKRPVPTHLDSALDS
jgi:hypothetical protein